MSETFLNVSQGQWQAREEKKRTGMRVFIKSASVFRVAWGKRAIENRENVLEESTLAGMGVRV